MEPDSTTPSLKATRLLGVRVSVTNYKSTMIAITFPTEQRIEITGRTQEGKIFFNYSTDRNFSNEVSVLTINPGERLEYTASVPTRSMSAGSTYIINASVVGQAGMEGAASITPVP